MRKYRGERTLFRSPFLVSFLGVHFGTQTGLTPMKIRPLQHTHIHTVI